MSPGPGHFMSHGANRGHRDANDAREVEPLPAGMIDELRMPGDPEEPPQRLQTHISHLFLTRDHVYKIRKAVDFGFLDFATRSKRNRDCLREVALNRRLSPDVYLGVAPITPGGRGWTIGDVDEALTRDGGDGAPPEHCVVMRRLPEACDAQSLLEAGKLREAHIDAIADRVASFHRSHRLPEATPDALAGWTRSVGDPFLESLRTVREQTSQPQLAESAAALIERAQQVLSSKSDVIRERRRAGLAVDGHGDLQLAHAWFEDLDRGPLIIDCTEFNADFRHIDPASEVAFLAMDLRYRGHPALAERFLARYARETGDFGLYSVVDPCTSYRAAVRAKVAVLASNDPDIAEAQQRAALVSARGHLALAQTHLNEVTQGSIVATCGIVGSGKSTVAGALADALGGVVISSDCIRKQRAGMALDDHTSAGDRAAEGLYREDRVRAVYDALLEAAAPVVESGRRAILDASFPLAVQRRAVLRWAEEHAAPPILIHVSCDRNETLDRLARRERKGVDPSDAGPSIYPWSAARFEAPGEWPEDRIVRVTSNSSGWQDQLIRDFGRVEGPRPASPFVQSAPK